MQKTWDDLDVLNGAPVADYSDTRDYFIDRVTDMRKRGATFDEAVKAVRAEMGRTELKR